MFRDMAEYGGFSEGKFCGVYNTNVYDLSEKSLEKIESDYINKDICVKMTEEQVGAFRYVHPVKRFSKKDMPLHCLMDRK